MFRASQILISLKNEVFVIIKTQTMHMNMDREVLHAEKDFWTLWGCWEGNVQQGWADGVVPGKG